MPSHAIHEANQSIAGTSQAVGKQIIIFTPINFEISEKKAHEKNFFDPQCAGKGDISILLLCVKIKIECRVKAGPSFHVDEGLIRLSSPAPL